MKHYHFFIATLGLILSLSACSTVKPHERIVQDQAHEFGLTAIGKKHFDAAFVLPNTDLSRYKKIVVNDLDFSYVKIIKLQDYRTQNEPWELTDEDKAYYQKRFSQSAQKFLFDDAKFSTAVSSGNDTLILKAKLTEIAPLAPKDEFNTRPNFTEIYSRGFGQMTIVFELYDSVSNKMIAIMTDEHDLGNRWEKNDRVQNNIQVRLAFDFWLRNLKNELQGSDKNKLP